MGAVVAVKRTTVQAMEELFGVPLSVGTISQSEKSTTEVVAEPVEEARGYVEDQDVAHLDETSWREAGKRAWLWVAVTSWVTVFVVRLSRGGRVARELLGEKFSGILVTDRYSAYNWYPVGGVSCVGRICCGISKRYEAEVRSARRLAMPCSSGAPDV